MSTIHSVIFNKSQWNKIKAKQELKKLGLKPIKHVDETLNYLRYRIVDPKEFKSFSTKNTNKGFKLIIGYY